VSTSRAPIAVFEQHGVLDKFIGDGMLAVFGSLDQRGEHEHRAVAAALRMKARLAKINGERAIVGEAPVQIGSKTKAPRVYEVVGQRSRLAK
jgi:class 3 adenylate cyclase